MRIFLLSILVMVSVGSSALAADYQCRGELDFGNFKVESLRITGPVMSLRLLEISNGKTFRRTYQINPNQTGSFSLNSASALVQANVPGDRFEDLLLRRYGDLSEIGVNLSISDIPYRLVGEVICQPL